MEGLGRRQAKGLAMAAAPLPGVVVDLRIAMALIDAARPEAPIRFANPALTALSGYTAEELLGRGLASLLARKGDTALEEGLSAAALAAMPARAAECCFRRKDGTTFWAALVATPLRDGHDGPLRYLLTLQDITPQRQENDRLRLLLGELNHRTQNMFSAVLELIRHSLRGKAPSALMDTLTGRILAFARAHSLLREEAGDRIPLRQVLELVLQPPTVPKPWRARVALEGESVSLPANVALTAAMALHELAVNAGRHGALSTDDGLVRIQWTVRTPPRGGQLALRWEESGGPPMKPFYEKGFGMRLIEGGVQHGLGGTSRLSLEAKGLVCEITLPLRQDGRTA